MSAQPGDFIGLTVRPRKGQRGRNMYVAGLLVSETDRTITIDRETHDDWTGTTSVRRVTLETWRIARRSDAS